MRACRSLELLLALLRLLVMMLEGPASDATKSACADELRALGVLMVLGRSRYATDPRFMEGAGRVQAALAGERFVPPTIVDMNVDGDMPVGLTEHEAQVDHTILLRRPSLTTSRDLRRPSLTTRLPSP